MRRAAEREQTTIRLPVGLTVLSVNFGVVRPAEEVIDGAAEVVGDCFGDFDRWFCITLLNIVN